MANSEKISRLCWNNNGWIKPSGLEGKSKDKNSYEYKIGFGHEEWLFDFDKLIKCYHYAFLEPIHRNRKTYVGQKFNISLYSINGINKKRYWIGRLKNVEVISSEAAYKIFEYYTMKGWINEMQNQLYYERVEEDISNFGEDSLFNIRFKPEDAELLEEPLVLSEDDEAVSSYRYILLNKNTEPTFARRTDGKFKFVEKEPSESEDYTTSYSRTAKLVELTHTHKDISKHLFQYLKETYTTGKVSAEHDSGFGTKIDIVLKLSEDLIFYEIKTYPSIKANIREALGQLLEYSYYPTKNLAKELIIVSNLPATEEIGSYLSHLRSQFDIPLYYQQFDLKEKKLKEKV